MTGKKKSIRFAFNAAGKKGKIALAVLAAGLGVFAASGYRHTAAGQRASDERLWQAANLRQDSAMQDPAQQATFESWLSQFDTYRNLPLREKAEKVDDIVNKAITYESDDKNYNVADYWASPFETVTRGRGDCDDFANLKHYVLTKRLGVDPKDCQVATANTQAGGHVFVLINFGNIAAPDYGVLDIGNKGFIYSLDNMVTWELRDICDGTSFKKWTGFQPKK